MTVSELMAALAAMPRDAEVGIVYDGGDRMDAGAVWEAWTGRVLIGADDEDVDDREDWPDDVPAETVGWSPNKGAETDADRAAKRALWNLEREVARAERLLAEKAREAVEEAEAQAVIDAAIEAAMRGEAPDRPDPAGIARDLAGNEGMANPDLDEFLEG